MMLLRLLVIIACMLGATFAHADYQPKAELVVDNVYAIVGPLGQRSQQNDGLDEVLSKHIDLSAFRHLENYKDLHRANMNRAFTEFEGQ